MTEGASNRPLIGIFGGSFNPPHVAHLIVAEFVREQFALDQILWIPNRQSPFKQQEELAPADDRLEMTRLVVAGNEAFEISELELRRSGMSYTVDTIRMLQNEHPAAQFHLIVGSDSLAGFEGWREPDEILRRVRLIVYPRPGHLDAAAPAGHGDSVLLADAPLLDVSSSLIRKRRQNGKTIRYMVTEPVMEYISHRRLYIT